MKPVLPSSMVLGMLVFVAAGAHWPRSGSTAAVAANEPAVIRVHGSHADCDWGIPMSAWAGQPGSSSWHKHTGKMLGNMYVAVWCPKPNPPSVRQLPTIQAPAGDPQIPGPVR